MLHDLCSCLTDVSLLDISWPASELCKWKNKHEGGLCHDVILKYKTRVRFPSALSLEITLSSLHASAQVFLRKWLVPK